MLYIIELLYVYKNIKQSLQKKLFGCCIEYYVIFEKFKERIKLEDILLE